MIEVCPLCELPFEKKQPNRKYCTDACRLSNLLKLRYLSWIKSKRTTKIGNSLSFEEWKSLKESRICVYCGEKADSLDRVNSRMSYSLENVVPACLDCNLMKGGRTLEQFRNKLKKIHDYLGLGHNET